jgi:uncharacterized protein (TIGR03086 family)
MEPDLINLYDRASSWARSKVAGAIDKPDASTPCDEWDVKTLMNHMVETQRYFLGAARGENASRPSPNPPDLIGDDPVAAFDATRADVMQTYGEPGAIEKNGFGLGIAFCDQLLHGWDLAKATGQDPTMPDGLPEAAFNMIRGKFTDEQRKGIMKPEVKVPSDASAQDKLLAYSGRDPNQ